jgi:hypothetical protein
MNITDFNDEQHQNLMQVHKDGSLDDITCVVAQIGILKQPDHLEGNKYQE